MDILDKFQIYEIDKYNIGVREWKETFDKDSISKGFSWVDCKKYFGTLEQALTWLENEIIKRNLNQSSYRNILALIYQLKEALGEKYGKHNKQIN